MPAFKPSTEARQRKRCRRRFQIEALESRRLLAAELDYGDAPDLGSRYGQGNYFPPPEDKGPSLSVSAALFSVDQTQSERPVTQ